MFELSPLQKYQIIDAYNKNGMDAVFALLNKSVDNPVSEVLAGLNDDDDAYVMHEGKRYLRI